jgi:2-oxoglutarate dehydrogenase E1 component
LEEFGPGAHFRRVLRETDDLVADAKVKRVVLCSGKVYFDLLEERRERGIDDVAIIRIEQLYPWPRDNLTRQLARYANAEVIWCQEEPANMGAWMFVLPRLGYILEDLTKGNKQARRPIYVGRIASASPAAGSLKIHNAEQARLVDQALAGKAKELLQPFKRPPDVGKS